MKGYRDTRLLEMLDYIDPKYIEKTKKYYKSVPVSGAAGAKIDPKKQIKYITALVAAVLLLSAFIPAVTYIIQNHLHFAGYSETTGGDTTLAPEITSEEITSSPEPESSAPETTEPEPTHETTEPLYDGTTASPEPEYDGSRGLVYKLSEDGNSAWLFGMGTCTDENIVVASTYNGVPVTMIGETALADYPRVKSVTLPETVTAIDMRAFKNCTGLEKVSIPEVVSFIGGDAFENCKLLKNITLPAGLEKLETTLFMNCIGLESVVIPAGVKSISSQVFRECTALRELDYLGTVNEWNAVAKDEDWNLGSVIKVVHCTDGDVEITSATPPEPEHDGSQGLEYQIEGDHAVLVGIGSCTDKDIVVASSYMGYPVKYIGWSAFEKNDDIKSVVIPEGIETIVQSAFRECSALVSVSLPESVKSIGDYAFYICPSLSEINLPNGLDSIGKNAFARCTLLTQITIPESISVIKEDTFYACSALKQISIPESITRIEGGVFQGCSGISDLYIPKNVTYIGELNFQDVEKFTIDPENPKYSSAGNCFIDKETKTLLKMYENSVLPDDGSIEIIGETAIDAYLPIKELILPEGVRYICEGSLTAMATLEYLHLPSTFAEYEQNSFSHFLALKKITIADGNPKYYVKGNCLIERASGTVILGTSESMIPTDGSIKHIGAAAFAGNTNLTSIVIPEGVVSVQVNAFAGCSSLNKVTFPKSLERIGACAFRRCDSLKSIELGVNVKYIEAEAFSVCKGLTEIILPKQITSIGPSVFSGCESLESVILPEGVDEIDRTLFGSCSGLVSLRIPKSVTKIEKGAFADCKKLSDLVYSGTVREWNGIQKESGWNEGCPFTVVHCSDGDAEVNEHDGSYGLEYRVDGNRAVLVGIGTCTDKNIVIASKYNGVPVTEIGDSAFLGCSGIKSVLIPESVTSIGAHAFSLCENLESVNIPNKVTSIETYAFHACKSLKVIDIGNVTKIDDFAFTMCEGLESISFGNKLQSIGYQAFFHCSSLKELTFPDSLTSIGDWAFDCSSLSRVSVGKNIKKIGEAAFIMCSELSEFVYRGTRESWKSVTLGEDWKSRQITLIKCSDGDIDLNAPPEYDGSRGLVYQLSKDKKSASLVGIGTCTDKNIVIASTFGGVPVVSVAEGVFKDNESITGIHVPATVTTLNRLFYNCRNVKSLTVDPDHPSFYSAGNCIIDKQSKTILVGCNGSVIPDDGSILRIGMSSFDGCNGITELTIPDGVLIIYDYAFDNCINLRSVKIPESLTKINSAFNGCTSLEHVELPSEMEWVGGFSGCTSLKKITLPKTGKLSSGAFKDCTALESVSVPSGTTSLNSTFEGCTSLKSVILPDTLTSISKSSFLNCSSLESITIPKGVTELNDAAFKNCPKLLTVNFAGTAEEWRSIFKATDWNQNCNFSAVHCSDGDALPGPESDGSIGLEYVFDIKKRYATLIGIGTCTDSEIVVPTTYGGVPVTAISQAFGGNFTSIVISDSVTDIENGAFADCPNLRSIHFPSSVNNIPVDGLFNCKYLESLSVDPENPNYTSSGNCIIDKRTGILILGTNNGTIPSDGSVNEIGAKAFINRSGLTDIVIPEGVNSIGEYAFANCTALKSVSMPNSLIEINHYAFSGCSSLKEMKIVAAVVIFDYAFKDCTGLESIDLPDSCEVLHHIFQ